MVTTHKRTVLMNPGPVLVDDRVRAAVCWPDLCHREPEFAELMTRVREEICRVCGGDESYSTVMLTGSGTAALEAAISSAVPPDGKLLVLDNGHYGERLAKIASLHGIAHAVLEVGWAATFDLDALDRQLRSDSAITHVCMVHHETSTGMLNPLHQVGEIVYRNGKSLIVDAISSLGGELVDVRADHVDWCLSTANKCIEAIPGLSFVVAPRARLKALAGLPARTFYLDLHSHWIGQERDQAPLFTPAVQAMFALKVALELLLQEGVAGRNRRYKALAHELRSGLEARGFRLLLAPEYRSSLLTAVYLPDGLTYEYLHDQLKARGFVIYAAQDALKARVFRLSNIGQITLRDIGRFFEALDASCPTLRAVR